MAPKNLAVIFTAVILSWFITEPASGEEGVVCFSREDVLKTLKQQDKQQTWFGVTYGDAVVELWKKADDEWVLFLTTTEGWMCPLGAGADSRAIPIKLGEAS